MDALVDSLVVAEEPVEVVVAPVVVAEPVVAEPVVDDAPDTVGRAVPVPAKLN